MECLCFCRVGSLYLEVRILPAQPPSREVLVQILFVDTYYDPFSPRYPTAAGQLTSNPVERTEQ